MISAPEAGLEELFSPKILLGEYRQFVPYPISVRGDIFYLF
jgi:hypothetical protein